MKSKVFSLFQLIFFLLFMYLLISIIYGVVEKDILAEGSVMLNIYWGKFTFIDIYIAFLIIYMWVFIREKSNLGKFVWFILFMLGGSMTICLYIFLAIRKSNNNVSQLLLGSLEVGKNG